MLSDCHLVFADLRMHSFKNLIKAAHLERWVARDSKCPVLVFTHIPKTGGGSLTQIFRDNFPAEQIMDISALRVRERSDAKAVLSQEINRVAKSIQVIYGHVNFSYNVQQYLRRDCANMTLLREPVERVISLFYFVRQLKNGNKIAEEINQKGISLDDFAVYETFQPLDNIQVRYLANSRGPDSNLTIADRHLLEEAKENLLKRFDIFGVTEHFDVFAERLCRRFNLTYNPSVRLNDSGKPGLEMIAADTVNKIRERNSYDLELWQFAKKTLGLE